MMYLSDKRAVVHMDLDAFFVSVERLRDSRLEGIPLIIGGSGDRGVVASCSYEARKFGVHSAMPMKLARRLCPHGTIISGDMELYSQKSHEITEIIREAAPVVEKSSIDEFYLDLSGLERFFGCYSWTRELRSKVIKESGLPISFGLSTNKTVAKVATGEGKPNGEQYVQSGLEAAFLRPLPVSRIPMVGDKTSRFLSNLGVRRIETLQEIPREFLSRIMGKPGEVLWQRAQGVDHTPVIPYSERKSVSTEMTFGEDTIDVAGLRATIARMIEKVGFKMREEEQLCATITVKVRYANFDTVTKQSRIPYTASDHVLYHKALELFEALYDRRLRVRLVGVRCSELIRGGYQINLFEDTEKQIRLYDAIDRIKHRFGAEAVMRAAATRSIRRGA